MSTTTNALPATQATSTPPTTTAAALSSYVTIVNSCGPYFTGGTCANLRTGPGTTYPTVMRLRNNVVFKVASTTVRNGTTWYKVGFDGGIRYPGRIHTGWWVSGNYAEKFQDVGVETLVGKPTASTTKRIVINLTEKKLYAYDGDALFMSQSISPGLRDTPTPAGTFWVFKKMPDSYMQGPVPGVSSQYYDLPGVPWSMYFTEQGAAIHGAYWHDNFGKRWSHGCVNLPPDQARILYNWAPLGTPVLVKY